MALNYYRFSFDSVDYGHLNAEDPTNYDDLTISADRDSNTHGIFFDVSNTTFHFWGEGAEYLRTAFNAKGIEAKVTCTIEETCDGGVTFEELSSGAIDFTKKDEALGNPCLFSVPITAENCLIQLQKRVDENVEITTDSTLTVPGKNIRKSTNIYQNNSPSDSYTITDTKQQIVLPHTTGSIHTSKVEELTPFMDIASPIYEDVFQYNPDNISQVAATSLAKTFQAIETGLHDFDVNFEVECEARIEYYVSGSGYAAGSFTNFKMEFFYKDVAGVSHLLNTFTNNTPVGNNVMKSVGHFSVNDTRSVNLNPGDIVTWYFKITTEGDFTAIDSPSSESINHIYDFTVYDFQSSFNVSLLSSSPATPAKGVMIDLAFERIVQGITGSCVSFKSDFFGRTDGVGSHGSDGCAGLNFITNGDKLRQKDDQKSKLFLSLKYLFDAMCAIYNIGMGIEKVGSTNYLRAEPVKYFYDDTVVLTFENVPGVKVKFDETLCANKLSIGYTDWEAELTNGQDEIMTKREYANNLTLIKGELRKDSELIASNYAIETTRRMGNTSEDFKYDNNKFIFCLKRLISGGLVVDQGNINPATKFAFIDYASGYNYNISPARNAKRWWKTAMVGVKNYLTETLNFKYGEGNYIAQSELTDGCSVEPAGTVTLENGNISASTIDAADKDPLYSGEVIDVPEVPFTNAQLQTLKANPHGLIGILPGDSGPYLYGWIKSFSYEKKKRTAKFTLLKQ